MKNEKLMEAARTLQNYCCKQPDCAHCDFEAPSKGCLVGTIPSLWLGELDKDIQAISSDEHIVDTNKKVDQDSERPAGISKTSDEATRAAILESAKGIVCGDREKQYGSPEDNFGVIARLWSVYTGHDFSPVDVALMMALLKIARIKTGHYKADSFIDACGYFACAAEIAGRDSND